MTSHAKILYMYFFRICRNSMLFLYVACLQMCIICSQSNVSPVFHSLKNICTFLILLDLPKCISASVDLVGFVVCLFFSGFSPCVLCDQSLIQLFLSQLKLSYIENYLATNIIYIVYCLCALT